MLFVRPVYMFSGYATSVFLSLFLLHASESGEAWVTHWGGLASPSLPVAPGLLIWWRSTKKCDRESVHRRTDTHTHTHAQTQNDFIMSHAICYDYGADNYLYFSLSIRICYKLMYLDQKQMTWLWHRRLRTVNFQYHSWANCRRNWRCFHM